MKSEWTSFQTFSGRILKRLLCDQQQVQQTTILFVHWVSKNASVSDEWSRHPPSLLASFKQVRAFIPTFPGSAKSSEHFWPEGI